MWKFFVFPVNRFLMAATASLALEGGREGGRHDWKHVVMVVLTYPLSVSLTRSTISRCRAMLPAEAALSVARSVRRITCPKPFPTITGYIILLSLIGAYNTIGLWPMSIST